MGNDTAIGIQIITMIICFVVGFMGMICLFVNSFTLWAHLALAGVSLICTVGAFIILGGLVE